MKKRILALTTWLVLSTSVILFGGYCYDRLVRDVQRAVNRYTSGGATPQQYASDINIAWAEYDACLQAPAY